MRTFPLHLVIIQKILLAHWRLLYFHLQIHVTLYHVMSSSTTSKLTLNLINMTCLTEDMNTLQADLIAELQLKDSKAATFEK